MQDTGVPTLHIDLDQTFPNLSIAGPATDDLRNVGANYPFERSHRFQGSSRILGTRDYSRLSCGVGSTQLGPTARISAGMLARTLVTQTKMLSEHALAPDRARCERGCSRHCSCPGQDRGFRAIAPLSQVRRDAVSSCGLGGFGCAAHAVRKMSLPSPQSRRTYAGLRS